MLIRTIQLIHYDTIVTSLSLKQCPLAPAEVVEKTQESQLSCPSWRYSYVAAVRSVLDCKLDFHLLPSDALRCCSQQILLPLKVKPFEKPPQACTSYCPWVFMEDVAAKQSKSLLPPSPMAPDHKPLMVHAFTRATHSLRGPNSHAKATLSGVHKRLTSLWKRKKRLLMYLLVLNLKPEKNRLLKGSSFNSS